MRTLAALAKALTTRMSKLTMTKVAFANKSGVTKRTVYNALSGTEDIKVTTLFAMADALGLEVVLVPKEAAKALDTSSSTHHIPSIVDIALGHPRQFGDSNDR